MLEFKTDTSGINIILSDMQNRFNDLLPAMEHIGQIIQASITRNFEESGRPIAWAAHSAQTIKRRGVGAKILMVRGFSGGLAGSFSYLANKSSVRIKSDKVYAGTHHFGALKGAFGSVLANIGSHTRGSSTVKAHTRNIVLPWGNIPARLFMMVQDEDLVEIIAVLNDYITGKAKRGWGWMKNVYVIIGNIESVDGKAPEWFVFFKEGWNVLEGEGKFLADFEAYEAIIKKIADRGNDIVIDYEHQTLDRMKAPAAGWIKELRYKNGTGIEARVSWTDEAADYIKKNEYRYFSPVFAVRESDKRVIDIHSVALTNTPKTHHLTPILAKFEVNIKEEETKMDLLAKIILLLKLEEGASEEGRYVSVNEISRGKNRRWYRNRRGSR